MESIPGQAGGEEDITLLERLGDARTALEREIGRRVIGQQAIVEGLLTALMADGHALLVGVPGLAKTLLVSTLAEALDLEFSRIQFTPDLMPTDITGTEVIEEDRATGQRAFRFVRGPIFANMVLADEINRTPPKTQAALLQAMQERAVTAAGETYAAGPALLRAGDAEPHRAGGHLPAARGPARPLHAGVADRLSRRGKRRRRSPCAPRGTRPRR